jgi:hypothetical protein
MSEILLQKQTKTAIELVRKKNYSALANLIIDTIFRNNNIKQRDKYINSEPMLKMVEKYCKKNFSPFDSDQKIENSLNIAIFFVHTTLLKVEL